MRERCSPPKDIKDGLKGVLNAERFRVKKNCFAVHLTFCYGMLIPLETIRYLVSRSLIIYTYNDDVLTVLFRNSVEVGS